MLRDWTNNLKSEQDIIDFERRLAASRSVLDRLGQLLDYRITSMDISERGISQFENPNWAYRQAFNNGLRSAFNIVKTLITDTTPPRDQVGVRPSG